VSGLREVLKTYWGYDSFKPLQERAMQCVLEEHDSVVVLPTGGGKSLCFQAPAMCREGLAVVVSPLISLMKDQVDALRECGVPAACLNSSLSVDERRSVADDIRAGTLKLLYVAPERLVQERTLEFLQSANVSLLAIDEAHCISEWGHDFRPEYRRMGMLREVFPSVGIHAYTATATEKVRGDIAVQLGLREPAMLVGSFDRPNLTYRVVRRSDRLKQIRTVLDRHPGESGIIYSISRRSVDDISTTLTTLGYKALPYHAGLNGDVRRRNQDAFITDRAEIIVATVAFGMGIDKSNVRYVIHAGMPKSIENYQQESGRAGRDGLEAECVLLHSGADFQLWKRMLDDKEEPARTGELRSLAAMADFCGGVTCRHRGLLNHFGQDLQTESCNACDVCLCDLELADEPLIIGQKILSCVVRLQQRFGGDYTANVLVGSKEKRILESGHDRLSTYGLLAEQGKRSVRDWIEQLVGQKFLEKQGEYNQLQVTESGRLLLRGEVVPRLLKQKSAAKSRRDRRSASGPAEESWEGVDRELFERLRTLRTEKATDRGVPAYVVFGDAALRDMARRRPSTREGFLEARGVGEKKCAEYGEEFLAVIADHCQASQITMDIRPKESASDAEKSGAVEPRGPSMSAVRSFPFFQKGQSVAEVAEHLERAISTVTGYLVDYLRHERITDPSVWVDAETVRQIEAAAEEVGMERLKPIFEQLGGEIGYDRIRIVMVCLRNAAAGMATG